MYFCTSINAGLEVEWNASGLGKGEKLKTIYLYGTNIEYMTVVLVVEIGRKL